MLVTSLPLQQVKEVGTVKKKETYTECKILTYISLALTVFSLVMVAILPLDAFTKGYISAQVNWTKLSITLGH